MTHKRILSFKYAGEGFWTAVKEEPNLLFHLFTAAIVLTLGAYLKISKIDWMILILTIGLVISVELTNTAIEAVVDSFTKDIHPGAKKAKDVSAAAVLVISFAALLVGLLIFLPYFY